LDLCLWLGFGCYFELLPFSVSFGLLSTTPSLFFDFFECTDFLRLIVFNNSLFGNLFLTNEKYCNLIIFQDFFLNFSPIRQILDLVYADNPMLSGERFFKIFQFKVFIANFYITRSIETRWDSVINLYKQILSTFKTMKSIFLIFNLLESPQIYSSTACT
jgi:hypothetical protein